MYKWNTMDDADSEWTIITLYNKEEPESTTHKNVILTQENELRRLKALIHRGQWLTNQGTGVTSSETKTTNEW